MQSQSMKLADELATALHTKCPYPQSPNITGSQRCRLPTVPHNRHYPLAHVSSSHQHALRLASNEQMQCCQTWSVKENLPKTCKHIKNLVQAGLLSPAYIQLESCSFNNLTKPLSFFIKLHEGIHMCNIHLTT